MLHRNNTSQAHAGSVPINDTNDYFYAPFQFSFLIYFNNKQTQILHHFVSYWTQSATPITGDTAFQNIIDCKFSVWHDILYMKDGENELQDLANNKFLTYCSEATSAASL